MWIRTTIKLLLSFERHSEFGRGVIGLGFEEAGLVFRVGL